MIRVAKTTALVMATLVGIWILWKFREPALVFLLSLVVAAAARGPIERLAGLGLRKVLVLAAVYVAGGLVVGGLSLAAVYLVSDELPHAAKDFQRLYGYLANHALAVGWIKRLLGDHLPDADELLMTLVGRHGEQAIGLVVGTAFGLASAILEVLFVFVLSIYWALDREYFEQLWLSLLPLSQRVSARRLWHLLESELGAYARSEIAQSLLAGLVLGVGFSLLGIRYPALLAVVAAASWLIPWLGALIALAALFLAQLPALLFNWPDSFVPFIAATCFTAAVFLTLEIGVEPRLFNRRRYNSLLVVVAVIALAETFGMLGLLLGPMAAVVVQATLEHIERQRVAAPLPADMDALQARMIELKSDAASRPDLPREWMSIIDRLDALVVRARQADADA